MSESESEGAQVTRRRSPAAQASLPRYDDLLREILLRLPPQPSSLLRASAVCKQWRRLVTDPKFHRQFCAHHWKPPLLGVFRGRGSVFRSILDPPDRIPPQRFNLRRQTAGIKADVLGCRHGRVLLMDSPRQKVTVCDPITGECHHIDAPPVFKGLYIYRAVICAAAHQDHVHGSCHSSPFKVVLMCLYGAKYIYQDNTKMILDTSPIACVYSSENGVCGNLILTTDRCDLGQTNHGVLVGNVLYWSSKCVRDSLVTYVDLYGMDDIIEFDLDRQSLAVIKGPPCLNASLKHQIIGADNGDVGLAMFSHGRLEMWQRKVNCHGGATWLLHKTVEMHTVLGLPPQVEGWMTGMVILGYDDEDKGSIFVHFGNNVYMVQLISMQHKTV